MMMVLLRIIQPMMMFLLHSVVIFLGIMDPITINVVTWMIRVLPLIFITTEIFAVINPLLTLHRVLLVNLITKLKMTLMLLTINR
jgi:hypothetical protein